jgi:hypothetical protein
MANFAMRFERRPRGSKHLHAAGQIARDDKVRS